MHHSHGPSGIRKDFSFQTLAVLPADSAQLSAEESHLASIIPPSQGSPYLMIGQPGGMRPGPLHLAQESSEGSSHVQNFPREG